LVTSPLAHLTERGVAAIQTNKGLQSASRLEWEKQTKRFAAKGPAGVEAE